MTEPALDLVARRGRVDVAGQHQHGVVRSVGLVVALALLVLDHAALVIEPLLVQGAKEVPHAVALHIERLIEGRGRHGLEEVGAVVPGGAVPVGGPHGAQRLHQAAGQVLGRIEQADVLEQVSKAGLAARLVLGADIVPGLNRHDRRLAVGVDDDPQAIVQGELLERDIDTPGQFGRRNLSHDRRGPRRQHQRDQRDDGPGTRHDETLPDKQRSGRYQRRRSGQVTLRSRTVGRQRAVVRIGTKSPASLGPAMKLPLYMTEA